MHRGAIYTSNSWAAILYQVDWPGRVCGPGKDVFLKVKTANLSLTALTSVEVLTVLVVFIVGLVFFVTLALKVTPDVAGDAAGLGGNNTKMLRQHYLSTERPIRACSS